MASTFRDGLARVHQGGDRGGADGGGHTKERAMMVLRPAIVDLQERRGQVEI